MWKIKIREETIFESIQTYISRDNWSDMMYMQYPREPDQLLRRVVKRLTPPLPHLSEIPGCWYERKIIHNYLIGIIFSLLDLNKLHGVALQNNNNRKRTTNTSKWRIHMSNKVECILIILFKPWIMHDSNISCTWAGTIEI